MSFQHSMLQATSDLLGPELTSKLPNVGMSAQCTVHVMYIDASFLQLLSLLRFRGACYSRLTNLRPTQRWKQITAK